jgi:hypothetical protein
MIYAHHMQWISDYWGNGALIKLKAAVEKMEAVMEKYRKYGAEDTESDAVWQVQLIRTLKGKERNLASTVDFWELYRKSGSCHAALELYDVAKEALDVLTPIRDLYQVRKYVKDYCWRCCE